MTSADAALSRLRSTASRLADTFFSVAASKSARAIKADNITYLSWRKLFTLESEMRRVVAASIPGAFCEMGVALGGSSVLLARVAAADGREFAGFDLFGMIPPPSDLDGEVANARYQAIKSGSAQGLGGDSYYGYRDDLYERVLATLDRYDVKVGSGSKARLVRGLFENTIPEQLPSTVAFAHIDCDWKEPVSHCLASLADRLSYGGVLVIDDYHDYEGCKAAVDEFIAKRSDYVFSPGRNPVLRRVEPEA